jgi:hypothetical protein
LSGLWICSVLLNWQAGAAYHQQITNAFRNAYSYGQEQAKPQQLQDIMNQVYSHIQLAGSKQDEQ